MNFFLRLILSLALATACGAGFAQGHGRERAAPRVEARQMAPQQAGHYEARPQWQQQAPASAYGRMPQAAAPYSRSVPQTLPAAPQTYGRAAAAAEPPAAYRGYGGEASSVMPGETIGRSVSQNAADRAQQMNGGGRVLAVQSEQSGYRVKLLKNGEVQSVYVPN